MDEKKKKEVCGEGDRMGRQERWSDRETGARRKRWRDRKEKEGKQRVNGEMDKK